MRPGSSGSPSAGGPGAPSPRGCSGPTTGASSSARGWPSRTVRVKADASSIPETYFMAAAWDGPRIPASGGRANELVVFLHGYGADGNDLIEIGRQWRAFLPHA